MNTNKLSVKGIKKSGFAIGVLCISLLSCSQIPVLGQSSLSGDQRMNGKGVEGAFEAQRKILQQRSAAIYMGRKSVGYACIMSPDGHLLTKRSELFDFDAKTKKSVLRKNLNVIIDKEKFDKISLIASDIEWDLAIIKVEAENLTPTEWAEASEIDQGTWVVTNGSTSQARRRLNIGIISANAREIKGEIPVLLGVVLKEKDDKGGVEIMRVSKASGAEAAGVLVGDIFKKFGGVEITEREQILDIIRDKQPGDFVEVELLRGEEKLTIQMELKARKDVQGNLVKPKSRSDQMSGDYSERRASFPMVLQHDIDQSSRQMGGPLLNLEGKAVGINIARANRAESFAIPAKEAQQVYKDMLSNVSQ